MEGSNQPSKRPHKHQFGLSAGPIIPHTSSNQRLRRGGWRDRRFNFPGAGGALFAWDFRLSDEVQCDEAARAEAIRSIARYTGSAARAFGHRIAAIGHQQLVNHGREGVTRKSACTLPDSLGRTCSSTSRSRVASDTMGQNSGNRPKPPEREQASPDCPRSPEPRQARQDNSPGQGPPERSAGGAAALGNDHPTPDLLVGQHWHEAGWRRASVLTIDTAATPPEPAAAFLAAHSASWKRRSKCPFAVSRRSTSNSWSFPGEAGAPT